MPSGPASNDSTELTLGVRFTSDVDARVTGVRFYKGPGNMGTHTRHALVGDRHGSSPRGPSPGRRRRAGRPSPSPVPSRLSARTVYVASYHAPQGNWAFAPGYYDSPLFVPPCDQRPQRAVRDTGRNAFPTGTANNTNY